MPGTPPQTGPVRSATPWAYLRDLILRHPEDVLAVQIWLCSRVAVFFIAYATSWIMGPWDAPLRSIEDQWDHWDARWYREIAEKGYVPPNTGFFPVLPLVMRVAGPVLGGPIYASLIVNLIAGTVAAVLLRRVAAHWGFDGKWAVIALATAPTTVFLSAPYTEAIFLACALGAWLGALSGRYWVMAVLASLAALTRVNGFFLIVALVVLLVTRRVPWRVYAWLLVPLGAVGLLLTYMHSIRGNWFEWKVAQEENWNRDFVGPVSAFEKSWTAAVRSGSDPDFTWFSYNEMFMARLEILAAVVFVAAVIGLVVWRRWPEAVYTGLTAAALLTTTNYASLPRYLLVAWPVILIAGWLLARSSLVRWAWAAIIAPLAVLLVVGFSYGNWTT